MATKKYFVAILISIFLATVFATCRKNNCKQSVYNFKVGIKARPNIDSIALSDTLWFTINESNELSDVNLNRPVLFKNAANLSFVFGIRKVISAQTIQPSVSSFNYVIRKGTNIQPFDPLLFKEFQLVEENNRYLLEVGFIAKEKGIFRVLTESAANVYTRDNQCDKAGFSIRYVDTDQHFYLGYNISGEGVYYFKVY